eukprot:TRINITY_DN27532_c0_g1_i1.p1 TRINITY_DN27532_c0_g1~~TRINITY_DN27532_c0_g1_i1.p1  ORF type:complete len:412 (+),score=53.55 TRINITY_DN27532_c0_g1_i1:177-1412(+)
MSPQLPSLHASPPWSARGGARRNVSTAVSDISAEERSGGKKQLHDLEANVEATLRSVFRVCNTQGTNRIVKRDLVKACRTHRAIAEFFGLWNAYDSVVDRFFLTIDIDGDKTISWDEFRSWYVKVCSTVRNEARKAFGVHSRWLPPPHQPATSVQEIPCGIASSEFRKLGGRSIGHLPADSKVCWVRANEMRGQGPLGQVTRQTVRDGKAGSEATAPNTFSVGGISRSSRVDEEHEARLREAAAGCALDSLSLNELRHYHALRDELQQMNFIDHFDTLGKPRFRRWGLSLAAKRAQVVKDTFGSQVFKLPEAVRGNPSLRAQHFCVEALAKDAQQMKERTDHLRYINGDLVSVRASDVVERQLELMFEEIPRYKEYTPRQVVLEDLIPAEVSVEAGVKYRLHSEKMNINMS